MKLLLMLNESTRGAHNDIYNALEELKAKKKLEEYEVIPFLAFLEEGKSQVAIFNIILKVSAQLQPDVLLWSHTAKLKLNQKQLNQLKQLLPDSVMAYWDGDIYQSPYKKMPTNVIRLCRECDVVFCQGMGAMVDQLKSIGCKNILYAPASTSKHRFKASNNKRDIKYDVVMIGNRIIRKNPFLTMPGTRLRVKLVKLFYHEFGKRFAVYGHGWKGPFAKGPLPFLEQVKAYQQAKLVIGNNNLHAPYYFSNRLPIALSSGVPVLYNEENGLKELFPDEISFWYKKPEEALQLAKQLLDRNQDELNELGRKGRDWVFSNLETTHIFSFIIEATKKLHSNHAHKITNPWIKRLTTDD